ncbi:UNVERIFIED_CONTAM: hypothetical protein GTU68_013677 [Idotea baltica]|nr:hypothetical protein [Idotea baltica]
MSEGAPSLGIPPLDPLGPFPEIAFSIHNDYLDLEGTVNETTIYNLSEFITCEVTIDIGLRSSFYMELRMEDFHMDGMYDMDGVYVMIFPIFGTGNYVLDVLNASMGGGAGVSYNIITDHAQIHDLEIDILFEELQLYMECILGCGDMADFVND